MAILVSILFLWLWNTYGEATLGVRIILNLVGAAVVLYALLMLFGPFSRTR